MNALRKDSFNEEINLAVENLPPGFTATDALILAGQAQAHLTITAEKDEAAVTVSVPAQAPVGFRQNIILTGILKLGAENITNAVPAIPIKVVAPPK